VVVARGHAADREDEITELARRIAEMESHGRAHVFHLSWWSDKLLAQSMADPAFRTGLFRFVDAFPALHDDADVEAHFRVELDGVDLPAWLARGLGLTRHVPGGTHISAGIARRTIDRMARQFIVGTGAEETSRAVSELWSSGSAATVDLLGEHTHSEPEADRYAARLAGLVDALAASARRWPENALLERDDGGPIPRASVSVKVTALAPAFTPLTAEEGLDEAERRLLPILRAAAAGGVSIWFDVERYEVKALTHALFRRLLERSELETLNAGIVVQAYLRDSANDLADIASVARERRLPVGVRLVKGAYWDTETVEARARGWPSPVFEHKAETDASFEHLVGVLHDEHGSLRAAFGSHNARSLAVAVVEARRRGIPDEGYEIQLLYGMAEPMHRAVRELGLRLRVYAPMGELVPGMGYLVRRLLENTSNDSFVRLHYAEKEGLDELITPPRAGPLPGPAPLARRSATEVDAPGPYVPEPPAEFRRPPVLRAFGASVEEEIARSKRNVPAVIGGEHVYTSCRISSVNPADPDDVVAEVASCGPGEVDAAVSSALAAVPAWRDAPVLERAKVLFRAAEVMRKRRFELAALQVREVGKGWADADADVCEAIDYCEYYSRRMLAMESGGEVQSPPGEENVLRYRGRGVAAVVAPWNFPLAIAAGMTTAALAAGNTVVLKPAEQSPVVAAELVSALHEAGLPPGVLQFVPGLGEHAGAPLVADPRVDLIAFTGSREVGLSIVRAAAEPQPGRRSIPRVIAELGGKNAIVVDADADLDEVVPAVVSSAFGFAGQKCSAASRMICVGAIHDAAVRRVVDAVRSLVLGPPRRPGSQMGPVIDSDAHARLTAAAARAGEAGRVLVAQDDVPDKGWFVGPVVVDEVDPASWLAHDELFGPILAVFSVGTVEEAVELVNEPDYALTAGILTRSRDHARLFTSGVRAGNVYVNRTITGAVVGRQPFGGSGMSGVGSKAGGPDYLLQFCDPQVVSENTVRQGFAPMSGGTGSGGGAGGGQPAAATKASRKGARGAV
jgi:RHH-type proline utilization regulon transcriptional repressor/proline dehydrogenase/delta 1-pyrroline-5-carboxylate dehydrogenase